MNAKTESKNFFTRAEVRQVPCDECGAGRLAYCRKPDGRRREANHHARQDAFVRFKGILFADPSNVSRAEREASRAQVRSVPCSECGAGKNERCRSRRPEGRLSVHPARTRTFVMGASA